MEGLDPHEDHGGRKPGHLDHLGEGDVSLEQPWCQFPQLGKSRFMALNFLHFVDGTHNEDFSRWC